MTHRQPQDPIPGGGGFIPPSAAIGGLPSPAPSSTAASGASSLGLLPHPRSHSLLPGSDKEDMVRRYVEDRLLRASRRYVKKFAEPASEHNEEAKGYQTFGEVCRDLGGVIDVLWLSATPSLQIPFLFKVASDFTQYVRSFPPSPKPSFELLRKLDHCFSSLLCGEDIDTHESLPGVENGLRGGMTVTDMVRCRSLVEQARILMVEVLSEPAEDEAGHGDASDDDGSENMRDVDIDEDRMHLDAARIFENTIVHLNNRLGVPIE